MWAHHKRLRGFTLVELIVAIVIIGVGLAGLVVSYATVVRSSADPMLRKQLIAIAESVMEEISLKPLNDPGTGGSIATGSCDRSAADDVHDYAGYLARQVCSIDGVPVAALGGYRVSVVLTDGDPLAGGVTGTRISVTVSDGRSESFTLLGWRTGYY